MSKTKKLPKVKLPIEPLHDRLILKQTEADEVTKGGIIVPDVAKERPLRGIVLAAGKGKILDNGHVRPIAVKRGDEVLFQKYSGTTVKIDDGEYLMVREEDVLGIVTPTGRAA